MGNVSTNYNKNNYKHRILYGTGTVGIIRMEWHNAMAQLVYPVNWSNSYTQVPIPVGGPFNYHVAEARNIIVQAALEGDFEWLLFVDDDTELPSDALVRFNEYMESYETPIVCGLYFTKSDPAYPLIFRGRGNGPYWKEGGKTMWKMGDKVWADGIPMGCTMIHNSILKTVWEKSEEYEIHGHGKCRQVFKTPRNAWKDPQKANHFLRATGTEDLPFCEFLVDKNIFEEAGWPEIQKKEFPFLVDTNIFCWHRDLTTGQAFPIIKPK